MNLFAPGRLAAIGRSLRPVIGLFLRILLVVAVALAVAVIVNLRHSLIGPDLKVGPGVILLLLGSTVMHIIYAFGVSAVYRWVFDRPKMERTRGRCALYIVGAIVPAVFMNLLLLQILVFSDFGTIFRKTYWLDDFPFFFVPLLAYVLAVLYWPPTRLYIRKHIVDKETRAMDFLHSWTTQKRTFFLLSYLDLVYGATVVRTPQGVRMMDIVFIYFKEGFYYFTLRDGTRVCTLLNSTDIEKWLMADWLLKTNRGTYVNMLYMQMPNIGDSSLKAAHALKHILRKSPDFLRTEEKEALKINRRMKPRLEVFLDRLDALAVEGWDEIIAI